MINKLIQLISQESLLFEEFLELLERQKEALVANDIDLLNRVVDQQRDALRRSHTLNRERESLIEEIKQANAVDGDLTVARLLEFADENQAERLLQLKNIILDLNDKINETRNANALLLNQSREFIAHTMTALAAMNAPEPNYARPGDAKTGQTAALSVDRRI
ncbi:hypothetical protein GF377_04410 [candidate division GN15 bacterium]|nr:hypothetical protein [candidate division GN15 bacterium]